MKLTPQQIKKREFTKQLRGYSVEEVDSFLEHIAEEFDEVTRRNEELQRRIGELEKQTLDIKQIEKNIQDTLLKNTDNPSRAIDSAKKQASLIIKEAEVKAAYLLEKVRKQELEVQESIFALMQERNVVLAKLKALVLAQSSALNIALQEIEQESIEDVLSRASQEPEQETKTTIDIANIVGKIV